MSTLWEILTCAVIPVTQVATLIAIGLALRVDRNRGDNP